MMMLFQAMFDATSQAFLGRDEMEYTASIRILQAVLKGTLAPGLVFIGLGNNGAI
jgi:hypothetical protein